MLSGDCDHTSLSCQLFVWGLQECFTDLQLQRAPEIRSE